MGRLWEAAPFGSGTHLGDKLETCDTTEVLACSGRFGTLYGMFA